MAQYRYNGNVTIPDCVVCQSNSGYPHHQRPSCPHHGFAPPPHRYPYSPPAYNPHYPSNPSYNTPPSTYPTYPPQPPSRWPSSQASSRWVDGNLDSSIPQGAVRGGTDSDGSPIYVGKAFHGGDWLPAKVIPNRKYVAVSFNEKEHSVHQFQVLIDANAYWVPGQGGQVPPNSIEGGRTASGEKLYIGRVLHSGSQTVGKIHPSHRTCYIPFGRKEWAYPNYEVLVSR